MTASTKALIERLRGTSIEVINVWELRHEAADALERLTQPVGVEPVAKSNGIVIIRLIDSPIDVDVWEFLCPAETVARLIAERDKANKRAEYWKDYSEAISSKSGYDALQEQVKMLRAERDEALAAIDAKIDICGDARIGTLQEHVKMLHEAAECLLNVLNPNMFGSRDNPIAILKEALAATEPKE